jgi:thiol-disulfide isomerase/thioredoxin
MSDPESPAPVPENVAEKAEKLEGEDAKDLVGIMYSERKWVVPAWYKAVFFWTAIVGVFAVVGYTIEKRIRFTTLLVDSVVEPEPWGSGADRPAPTFALPQGETGAQVDLTAFKGKWVLLNFWATWCAPCRDEMPSMEMLNRRVDKDGLNLEIVAVSVDDAWGEVNRFFGAVQPTFTVLWDKEKKSSNAYGTRKFPETYLIDPSGKVVAKFVGPRDWYNQGTVQYFHDVISGRRKPVG